MTKQPSDHTAQHAVNQTFTPPRNQIYSSYGDRYFGISKRIARWKECSEFESALATAAGDDPAIKFLYALFYKSIDQTYYDKGKNFAFKLIQMYPADFAGCNFEEIYTDMVYCLHRYGFSFEDYCVYRLKEKTERERDAFVSDKLRYYYYDIINEPFVNDLLTNKYTCYEEYREFYNRDVVKCESMTDKSQFLQFINKHKRFIYKPMSDHSGHGIEIIDTTTINPDEWFSNTVSYRPGIIEELITQGEALNSINPISINTCRIVTFTINKEVSFIGGALRIGLGDSITDNAGSGGIYASIDMRTGRLQSDAMDLQNRHYSEHPNTKTKIPGFQLPEWNQAIDLIKRMALHVNGATIISWDIAFSDKGWLMVEGNATGAWHMLQSNLESGKKAELYKLMDRYFRSVRHHEYNNEH